MSARQNTGGIHNEVKQIIIEHDDVYASLENEKRLGWKSKDVERLWQLRTDKLNLLSQTEKKHKDVKRSNRKPDNPFDALAHSSGESGAEDVDQNLSVTGNKLIRAGKGPSYDKYYDFYKKLFLSATEHAGIFNVSGKRFMDIGCAPGGLCAYFIKDLGWSGVGFTLQIERGGLKVRFKDPNLQVSFCDMSDMDSVRAITETVSSMPKFDFINCGVVMGKHQMESIGEDRETALQVLRVNRNQFLAALKHLKEGGDVFWVFQSSSIGCWFYFLKKLQEVFRTKISLYSTLVPSRSPVYAICSDFDSKAAKTWISELESTTDFTDEHLLTWNVTTWEEAGPLIDSLREDLYKIWTTQRDGLKEIRLAASSELAQEELLLKKLSGSRPTGESNKISSFRNTGTASSIDNETDWRAKPAAPTVSADGWEKSKPARQNRKPTSDYRARRNVGDEDNWRR
jgi:hypothetical protein